MRVELVHIAWNIISSTKKWKMDFNERDVAEKWNELFPESVEDDVNDSDARSDVKSDTKQQKIFKGKFIHKKWPYPGKNGSIQEKLPYKMWIVNMKFKTLKSKNMNTHKRNLCNLQYCNMAGTLRDSAFVLTSWILYSTT